MTEPVDTTQPIAPPADERRAGTEAAPSPMAPAQDGAGPPTDRPRLAEGVELLGRMKGSGYKDPPYMARRGDGQMVQLPGILYLVAERADGRHTLEQIAAEVSRAIGRGLDADGVRMLAEEKLAALGLLALPDGSSPPVEKPDPFLGLKLKTAVVPPRVVRAITVVFKPFFWPPVIAAVLAGLVAFDAWYFFGHGMAEGLRQILYEPLYLLLTFGFVILAAALHETGHATGCRYGGAEPGAMGVGIYVVWPAFYTDVTDSYRLGRGGRLRTDLGGVYFNAVFILALGGAYFATGFEPLLIPVLLAHLDIFRQLLPLLRLDGYHVLADLTGVPDLFTRIKPILVGLLPWRRSDPKVRELRWWVRLVVTLWVLVFVAFLALNLAYILVFAPRIFATGWDSFLTHLDRTRSSFAAGDGTAGAAGAVKMLALALPAIGIGFGVGRGGGKLVRGTWTRTRGRPLSRAGAVLLATGALGAVAAAWWPDTDYRPIRRGERFTVQAAAVAVEHTASGHPAFSSVPAAPGADQAVPRDGQPPTGTDEDPTPVTPTPTPSPSPSVSPSLSPSSSVSPSPTTSVSPTTTPSPTSSPTPTSEV